MKHSWCFEVFTDVHVVPCSVCKTSSPDILRPMVPSGFFGPAMQGHASMSAVTPVQVHLEPHVLSMLRQL